MRLLVEFRLAATIARNLQPRFNPGIRSSTNKPIHSIRWNKRSCPNLERQQLARLVLSPESGVFSPDPCRRRPAHPRSINSKPISWSKIKLVVAPALLRSQELTPSKLLHCSFPRAMIVPLLDPGQLWEALNKVKELQRAALLLVCATREPHIATWRTRLLGRHEVQLQPAALLLRLERRHAFSKWKMTFSPRLELAPMPVIRHRFRPKLGPILSSALR